MVKNSARVDRRRAQPASMSIPRTIVSLGAAFAVMILPWIASAAEKKAAPGPNEPSPSSRTFYIDGMKSDADVKAITAAASKVKSVTGVVDLTPTSGFANISFDHHAVTHQQIAQSIMDAGPFKVSFKFVVPDYPKGDNAAKMDAIFGRFAKLVSIEPIDRTKGSFVIRFLPFAPEPGKPLGMGFNFGHIAHPIIDPAPKGMALRIQQLSEGSLAKPADGGKKKAKK